MFVVYEDRLWHLINREELTQNLIAGMFYSFFKLATQTGDYNSLLIGSCALSQNWPQDPTKLIKMPCKSFLAPREVSHFFNIYMEEDLCCIKERHI